MKALVLFVGIIYLVIVGCDPEKEYNPAHPDLSPVISYPFNQFHLKNLKGKVENRNSKQRYNLVGEYKAYSPVMSFEGLICEERVAYYLMIDRFEVFDSANLSNAISVPLNDLIGQTLSSTRGFKFYVLRVKEADSQNPNTIIGVYIPDPNNLFAQSGELLKTQNQGSGYLYHVTAAIPGTTSHVSFGETVTGIDDGISCDGNSGAQNFGITLNQIQLKAQISGKWGVISQISGEAMVTGSGLNLKFSSDQHENYVADLQMVEAP